MRARTYQSEDLVQTSFTEIVLFLLFFALILLGTQPYLAFVPVEREQVMGKEQAAGPIEELKEGIPPEAEDLQEEPATSTGEQQEILRLNIVVTQVTEENRNLKDQLSVLGRRVQNTEQKAEQQNQTIILLTGDVTKLDGELNIANGKVEQLNLENEKLIIIVGDQATQIAGLTRQRDQTAAERDSEGAKNRELTIVIERRGQTIDEQRRAIQAQEERINWPPYLELADNDGYRFDRNSAILSPQFARQLIKDAIVKLDTLLKEYGDQVTAIEVIGHTDQERVGEPRSSNLDTGLLAVLQDRGVVGSLIPQDNAGLGLARAVSVADFIRRNSPTARKFDILPYSAAHLITNQNKVTNSPSIRDSDRTRRRIEIRLRGRSQKIQ